jgi:hypothetical protein
MLDDARAALCERVTQNCNQNSKRARDVDFVVIGRGKIGSADSISHFLITLQLKCGLM